MNRNWITGGITALLLMSSMIGCSRQTTDSPSAESTASAETEVVVMTVIRTKTPQKPFNADDYTDIDPNQGGNQGGNHEQEPPDIQEKGDGMALEGYIQLLDSIDRSSLNGPDGWNRHPVDDLFDGIFETTDQGTNKYGHGESNFTVSWQLQESLVLDAYTVVTGSDTEAFVGRNPRKWTITASEDGENWVTLHSVEDAELPAQNYTPVTFSFENDQPYRYYRWNIEETGGDGFQASELLLYSDADNPILPEYVNMSDYILPDAGQAGEAAKEGAPLTSEEARNYISSHESLQSLVSLKSLYVDATCFGDGPVENLFDTIDTEEEFTQNGYVGKMGGSGEAIHIAWKMTQETSIGAYAMITGNDTSFYPERNPYAWTLYGSKDGSEWVVVDAVSDGKLGAYDFEPYVFEVASPEAYGYYCLVLEQGYSDFQLCELLLLG